MATTWELVQEHSIAPVGSSFWEHLNAQEGGGGGGDPYPVYYKDIEVSADVRTISIGVNTPRIEVETRDVEVDTGGDTEIDVPTIKVEVD